jgi:hypothetical protein
MDEFAQFESLLEEFGHCDVEEQQAFNECCGKTMEVSGILLICMSCGQLKDNLDYDVAEGTYTYRIGNHEYIRYGHTIKTSTDKIAELVTFFKSLIGRNGKVIDSEVLETACKMMHIITNKNIKKSSNRISLFAELLRYASIETRNILTTKEISELMGMQNSKFAKGNKFIIEALMDGKIDIDISKNVYNLYISKYLCAYNPDFAFVDMDPYKNINNQCNRKFCSDLIEVMLDNNIAHNTVIHSKCIAVVYFLIRIRYPYPDEAAQKKYFLSIVNIGENTFIKIFNTLISKDTQQLLIDTGRFQRT